MTTQDMLDNEVRQIYLLRRHALKVLDRELCAHGLGQRASGAAEPQACGRAARVRRRMPSGVGAPPARTYSKCRHVTPAHLLLQVYEGSRWSARCAGVRMGWDIPIAAAPRRRGIYFSHTRR